MGVKIWILSIKRVKLRKQSDITFVNYTGEITQPSDCLPYAEDVVNGSDF